MTPALTKTFYACIDIGCSELVTQTIQHMVNGAAAEKAGGRVVFYTGEDPATLRSQAVIRAKLNESPEVDGFVFFRLKQFMYGSEFNFEFLLEILAAGYEVHFAREDLPICSVDDLKGKFDILHCFERIESARDRSERYIPAV